MNVLSKSLLSRVAACIFLSALALSGTAHADAETYELGKPFPHARNQSLVPQWRLYVFEREGVRYFQINDVFGQVHATFAEENGDLLVIPSGTDTATVERIAASPKTDICGRGCTGGIVRNSGAIENLRSPKAIADTGILVFQDPTLQIRVAEYAAGQPIWRIIMQPLQAYGARTP